MATIDNYIGQAHGALRKNELWKSLDLLKQARSLAAETGETLPMGYEQLKREICPVLLEQYATNTERFLSEGAGTNALASLRNYQRTAAVAEIALPEWYPSKLEEACSLSIEQLSKIAGSCLRRKMFKYAADVYDTIVSTAEEGAICLPDNFWRKRREAYLGAMQGHMQRARFYLKGEQYKTAYLRLKEVIRMSKVAECELPKSFVKVKDTLCGRLIEMTVNEAYAQIKMREYESGSKTFETAREYANFAEIDTFKMERDWRKKMKDALVKELNFLENGELYSDQRGHLLHLLAKEAGFDLSEEMQQFCERISELPGVEAKIDIPDN